MGKIILQMNAWSTPTVLCTLRLLALLLKILFTKQKEKKKNEVAGTVNIKFTDLLVKLQRTDEILSLKHYKVKF